MIERLRDEGRTLWPEGSPAFSRWQRGWTELWCLINRLGERRDIKKQDLPTALREFIQEFEHTTERMFQVLHSHTDASIRDSIRDSNIETISHWCDFSFRCAIYAVTSFWIDDKTEERVTSIKMAIDCTTGKTMRTEVEHWVKHMRVPKKYRHATRDI